MKFGLGAIYSCLFVAGVLVLSTSSAVAEGPRIPADTIQRWTKNLPHLSAETTTAVRDLDPMIWEGVHPAIDIRELDLASGRIILSEASQNGWSPTDVFGHPFFATSRLVIYCSKETLQTLYQEFRVGTPYATSGILERAIQVGGEYFEKGTLFHQAALIVGNGRVVHLYDHPIVVKRQDPPYDFLNGHYEYFRVNIMDIAPTADGRPQFLRLRGRNAPKEEFRPFRGPFRTAIHSLTLSEDARTVRAKAGLGVWTFPNLPYRANQRTDLAAVP